MNALFATTLALAAAAPGGAFALDPALPHYQPRWFAAPMAPVRIVGYNDMHDLLEPILRRFKLAHPDVAIELDLPGTRFAGRARCRRRLGPTTDRHLWPAGGHRARARDARAGARQRRLRAGLA